MQAPPAPTPLRPLRSPAPSRERGLHTDYPMLFMSCLPAIRSLVAAAARRHRLAAHDVEDFTADVHLRLLQDDYAVLRAFRGRSSLRSFLRTVIERLCLDRRVSAWGKWRPTEAGRRQGGVVLLFERLTGRDRLTFDEACDTLTTNYGLRIDRRELATVYGATRRAGRPRVVGMDGLTDEPIQPDGLGFARRLDTEPAMRHALAVLRQAMATLSAADSELLHLYFIEGLSIADIARRLSVEQKPLYRRVSKALEQLRARMSPRLSAPEVRAAIDGGDWDGAAA